MANTGPESEQRSRIKSDSLISDDALGSQRSLQASQSLNVDEKQAQASSSSSSSISLSSKSPLSVLLNRVKKINRTNLLARFPSLDAYVKFIMDSNNDTGNKKIFHKQRISLLSFDKSSVIPVNAFSHQARIQADLVISHHGNLVPCQESIRENTWQTDVVIPLNYAAHVTNIQNIYSMLKSICKTADPIKGKLPVVISQAWIAACIKQQEQIQYRPLYELVDQSLVHDRPKIEHNADDSMESSYDTERKEHSMMYEPSQETEGSEWLNEHDPAAEARDSTTHSFGNGDNVHQHIESGLETDVVSEKTVGAVNEKSKTEEDAKDMRVASVSDLESSPSLSSSSAASLSPSSSPSPSSSSSSSSSSALASSSPSTKRRRLNDGDEKKEHANELTSRVLDEMSQKANEEGDFFRSRGYAKAAGMLRQIPVYIDTYEKARRIAGLSEKMANKIPEIVATGTHRKLHARTEKQDVIKLLQRVQGIGATTAEKYYDSGIRTLDDLRKISHSLSYEQSLGLKYVDDLSQRIPREETCRVLERLEKIGSEIDGRILVYGMGSFRRGGSTSGDMDFLITFDADHHVGSNKEKLLALESRLRNGLQITIMVEHGKFSNMNWSCRGIMRVAPGLPMRRIDFLVVPYEELAPALLYFTGSDYFNRSMRLTSRQKGMSLSQHGLWIPNEPVYVPATERGFFEKLGIPWRLPHERNVA